MLREYIDDKSLNVEVSNLLLFKFVVEIFIIVSLSEEYFCENKSILLSLSLSITLPSSDIISSSSLFLAFDFKVFIGNV